MQKIFLKNINIVICAILIIGVSCLEFANYSIYKVGLRDDIENISKLTSSNIYTEINSELSKSIHISLTMANDEFLKDWLHTEEPGNAQKEDKIKQYLAALRSKFGYDSVFLVSTRTGIYYHYEKLHKVVSRADEHDVWFYNFLALEKDYDLIVDTDEVKRNTLTVFINCRLMDTDGTVLGVVGVGIQMNQLQNLLRQYENNFNLQAVLVNREGILQIASDESLLSSHVFSLLDKKLHNTFLQPDTVIKGHWLNYSNKDDYLVVRYLDALDWFLVVKKDTTPIRNLLISQIKNDLYGLLIIASALIFFVSLLISQYKKNMLHLAMNDELTGLKNRRAFTQALTTLLIENKNGGQEALLFVLDIDLFKNINDTYGHFFGDKVIIRVGELMRECLGSSGEAFRWGGDEFFGIVHCNIEQGQAVLEYIHAAVQADPLCMSCQLTLSIGATRVGKDDTFDSLLARADKALYNTKNNGRNAITLFNPVA
ncbi:MAG: sensor domain-containing diguanylate cyclase [Desulfovibrionaceae bacterium]|nr:sensor domain-containing diguanylate cyclase [Desulfovibrionaceae bacterium]